MKTKNCQNFFRVEFKLNRMNILYGLKLRTASWEPMFAIVNPSSTLLKTLREGDVITMKYYSSDRSIPGQDRATRIKYIRTTPTGQFNGHCMIGLETTPGTNP